MTHQQTENNQKLMKKINCKTKKGLLQKKGTMPCIEDQNLKKKIEKNGVAGAPTWRRQKTSSPSI